METSDAPDTNPYEAPRAAKSSDEPYRSAANTSVLGKAMRVLLIGVAISLVVAFLFGVVMSIVIDVFG